MELATAKRARFSCEYCSICDISRSSYYRYHYAGSCLALLGQEDQSDGEEAQLSGGEVQSSEGEVVQSDAAYEAITNEVANVGGNEGVDHDWHGPIMSELAFHEYIAEVLRNNDNDTEQLELRAQVTSADMFGDFIDEDELIEMFVAEGREQYEHIWRRTTISRGRRL